MNLLVATGAGSATALQYHGDSKESQVKSYCLN